MWKHQGRHSLQLPEPERVVFLGTMPATLNPPKKKLFGIALQRLREVCSPTKILEMSSGGQLWLAELPTAANK